MCNDPFLIEVKIASPSSENVKSELLVAAQNVLVCPDFRIKFHIPGNRTS